jgi:hypothetical protein
MTLEEKQLLGLDQPQASERRRTGPGPLDQLEGLQGLSISKEGVSAEHQGKRILRLATQLLGKTGQSLLGTPRLQSLPDREKLLGTGQQRGLDAQEEFMKQGVITAHWLLKF